MATKTSEKLKQEEEKVKRILAYKPSIPATKRKTPRQSYRGKLEKRLHLVEFVIGKQITMQHAHERSFKGRKSIKWGKMCEAWNKAHPDDQMTPEILSYDFNNAIRDENVQRDYFDKKKREFDSWWNGLLPELLHEINEGAIKFSPRPPGIFDNPLPESFEDTMHFLSQYRKEIKIEAMRISFDWFLDEIAAGRFTELDLREWMDNDPDLTDSDKKRGIKFFRGTAQIFKARDEGDGERALKLLKSLRKAMEGGKR